MLDTLRKLAEHHAQGKTVDRRKLAKLALWTSKGWTRKRPVYATDDPVLIGGLGDRLPVWRPGGGLEQFRSLIGPLRVTEIRASEARVLEPELAQEDEPLTDLFRGALDLLRDDLQRNDPNLADGLVVPWGDLEAYTVRVHPSLTLAVSAADRQEHNCAVKAKIDTTRCAVFVREPALLASVDGGGRALATLFEDGARLVAQAWRAACDRAEEGEPTRHVELAHQRALREAAELDDDDRLAGLQQRSDQNHASSKVLAGREIHRDPQYPKERGEREQSLPAYSPRTLVNPQGLVLVDAKGRIEEGSPSPARDTKNSEVSVSSRLNEPTHGSPGPQNRTSLRGYTDLDKESVGLELLRTLFSTDQAEIHDLRAQRGVGADAVDELTKYYEIKVTAGSEPDQVTLTDSEVQRALTTRDFFLVVVSNIEGADARPTVRVVVDPLEQLQPTGQGSITLSGLHKAKSLVYTFVSGDKEHLAIDEVEPSRLNTAG